VTVGPAADQSVCPRATRDFRLMRGSRQTVLLARRTRTMKQCSFDARSKEQSAYSLGEVEESEGPYWGKDTSWRVQVG
jgi:hypothetical protein